MSVCKADAFPPGAWTKLLSTSLRRVTPLVLRRCRCSRHERGLVPGRGLEPRIEAVLKRWPLPFWRAGRIGVVGETRTPKATRSERASYADLE